MEKTIVGPASSSQVTVLSELDELIKQLAQVCSALRKRGDPSLVDLHEVLRTALRLRQRIRNQDRHMNLLGIIEAVVFLAKLADEIYSLLFCYYPREREYADWDYYKDVAHCPDDVTGRIGGAAGCYESVPVAGRK